MKVPPSFIDSISEAESTFCREIRRCDPHEAAGILAAHPELLYHLIKPYLEKYDNPKVLEIGSGYGFQLCDLLLRGIDVVGVEPGESSFAGRFEKCRELLRENSLPDSKVLCARGEALPFPDHSFDIVSSADVIEHVQDVSRVLSECYRVLKPNGVLVMAMPNYNSYREHHYNFLWIPYLLKSKLLARLYARIRGRQDYYIDTLNFTTPRLLKKLLRNKKTRIIKHGAGKLSRVTEVYFWLVDEEHTFNHPRLAKLARLPLGAAVAVMELAGFVQSFTVVVKK